MSGPSEAVKRHFIAENRFRMHVEEIRDSHLFMVVLFIGILFLCLLWPSYWQRAQATAELAFEFAEDIIAGEGAAGVGVALQRGDGWGVLLCNKARFPVAAGAAFAPRGQVEHARGVGRADVRRRARPPAGPRHPGHSRK